MCYTSLDDRKGYDTIGSHTHPLFLFIGDLEEIFFELGDVVGKNVSEIGHNMHYAIQLVELQQFSHLICHIK